MESHYALLLSGNRAPIILVTMNWKALAPLASITFVACGGDLGGGEGGQAGVGAVAGANTGGTDQGAGAGGVSGSSPSGGAAGGPSGGTGGSTASMGFDAVIGCGEVFKEPTFWAWATPMARFDALSISGDGRVVGGMYDGIGPLLWSPDGSFTELSIASQDDPPLPDSALLEKANCEGTVFLGRDPWTERVWRVVPGERADFLFGGEGEVATPLSLSPDGSSAVGNLDSPTDVGPRPTLWTSARGAEPLDSLRNSLVHRVGNDAAWVVGEDVRHIFRFEGASGKISLASNGGYSWPMLVSPDGSTVAVSDGGGISLVTRAVSARAACPDPRCYPLDISGTGKLVLAVDGSTGNTLLVNEHGYHVLDDIFVDVFGGKSWNYLGFIAMSHDARAFIGVAYGYQEGPNVSDRPFYAVLPPDALD